MLTMVRKTHWDSISTIRSANVSYFHNGKNNCAEFPIEYKTLQLKNVNDTQQATVLLCYNHPSDLALPLLRFQTLKESEKFTLDEIGKMGKLDPFFMSFPEEYIASVITPKTIDNLTKPLIL